MPDAEIAERVSRVARTLRIEHLLERKTDKLSGGEMQRVSIGRAIVRKPRVFLMDEPLSALDAKLREALRTELKNIQMNLGQTFLFVTHDQIEAMSMGDKIGVLNHGHLVQIGTPNEIYNNPKNTFVARAVGSPPMNLIDGRLVSGRAIMAPLNFELPYRGSRGNGNVEGRALTFGIRPEDVRGGLPAHRSKPRLHDVENHGVEKILTLRVGDAMLRATVPAQTNLAIDESVRFSWNPAKGRAVRPGNGREPSPRGLDLALGRYAATHCLCRCAARASCGAVLNSWPSVAAARQGQRGSARMARAIATMSARPPATIASACLASSIMPTARTGMPTAFFTASARCT